VLKSAIRSLASLRAGVAVAALLSILVLAVGARAQDAVPPETTGEPGTAAEAERLLSLLDQPEVRAELRELLVRHLGSAEPAQAGDLLILQQERLRALAQAWSRLDEELSAVAARAWDEGFSSALGHALLLLTIALLAAFAATRALGGLRDRARPDPQAPASSRLAAGLGVVLVDLVVPLVYLLALNLASLALSAGRGDSDQIVGILTHAGLWVLGVAIAVDLLWSPRRPESGLFRAEPGRAPAVARLLGGIALSIMAIAAFAGLLAVEGMAPLSAALLAVLLSVALLLALLIGIWRRRSSVAAAIRGAMPDRSVVTRLAPLWPLPVTLYLVVVWGATLNSIAAGRSEAAGRLILSIILPLVIAGMAAALSRRSNAGVRALARSVGEASGSEEEAATRKSLDAAASRLSLAVWLVAILLALGLLAWLYELNIGLLLGLDPSLFRAGFKALCVGLTAYVVYAMIAASIEVRMARLHDARNPSRARRLRTLLPLLRGFLLQVVIVMAVLISLSALGVDIGPLIAGAGIFGLAIGLGTQKLVTDIVSGVFFLVDDAFAIGDYIEVGGLRGQVESLSIRSMKLRHHRGPVHTLPYGEIASLTNHSRDWVIVKLEFRVPSETDLGLVKKIVKQIGQEVSADPVLGKSLLEPVKSQGVRRFEDNAMIIGVKFKAVPGEQFVIRRQVFQKIRDAFVAAGVRFADRGVVVHVSHDASDAEIAASAAAAGAAIAGAEAKGKA